MLDIIDLVIYLLMFNSCYTYVCTENTRTFQLLNPIICQRHAGLKVLAKFPTLCKDQL